MFFFLDRVPQPAALESARKLIRCGVTSKAVQDNYTIYGNYLNPQVPVDCGCGPIDKASLPASTTQPPGPGKSAQTATPSDINPGYLYGILGAASGFTILLCVLFAWIWKRRYGKVLQQT